MALRSNLDALNAGSRGSNFIILICLAIPAIMTLRSLCFYGNTYCMQWVSDKVAPISGACFSNKMVRLSMDFFNKMRAGFPSRALLTRTRVRVQMALTAVSADVFKTTGGNHRRNQRAACDGLKFTTGHTGSFSHLFDTASHLWKSARKALRGQFEGMGEMVVTMQETFAGIRVIKSFAGRRTRKRHSNEAINCSFPR